jgi:hypothetical protein
MPIQPCFHWKMQSENYAVCVRHRLARSCTIDSKAFDNPAVNPQGYGSAECSARRFSAAVSGFPENVFSLKNQTLTVDLQHSRYCFDFENQ